MVDKPDFAKIRTNEDLEPFIEELKALADGECPNGDIPTFLRHVQDLLRAPQTPGLPDDNNPSWAWMAQLLMLAYERMRPVK